MTRNGVISIIILCLQGRRRNIIATTEGDRGYNSRHDKILQQIVNATESSSRGEIAVVVVGVGRGSRPGFGMDLVEEFHVGVVEGPYF